MNHKTAVLRPQYLAELKPFIGTEQVKVLQGVRRCGKSTILRMICDELAATGVPKSNIYYKRFDEFGLPMRKTGDELTRELSKAFERSDPSKMMYVFLDEIQEVDQWEKVVRGLHTRENTDVYITGSNAALLSSDLATLLAGRTITFNIYPLSFAEYLDFIDHFKETSAKVLAKKSTDDLFLEYLRFGGMPSLFSLQSWNPEIIARELDSIYNTVILRDVAERLDIRDIALLNRLVSYLFSTSGNLFSTRKIVGALVSSGRKTSAETVENYIAALSQAFIINGVAQTGLRGKKALTPLRKFYPVDTGLRNMANDFSASRDLGFQLENVVCNELLRRGWKVEVGTDGKAEVDFVARKYAKIEYFQVTETMLGADVRARELAPLQALRDSFPKTVLTLDHFSTGTTEDGINIVNIIDWLTAKQ
ncbi:ATP-binding protein [Bifidobacterium sp. ESL0728]|uniref:ATP-binding protein n=1 Tax=Bifidobacterium sp. ESL0728 TaxID=2983220 RepID=UPI0023F8A55B|nr:ATP-binding protein [Bifidobacterium sp. ESL0728]WEV59077.1 ATP-binding protein [Bifidobacterium sp. ESL0728]